MAEQRPQIPYVKEFLPTLVCIVLSLFFAMVFQFNGGVFLPAATQMSSALGCIQEDVTMAGYASFIGMLMVVWICVMCLTRTIRLGKKIPLYGIDWIGLLLWTVMLFAIVFICIYGDFYDWLDSMQIRSCIVIAVVSLLININRMTSIRHPYIDPQVFRYKKFPVVLFLFLMLCLFLTTSSVLQNAFINFQCPRAALAWRSFVSISSFLSFVKRNFDFFRKTFDNLSGAQLGEARPLLGFIF